MTRFELESRHQTRIPDELSKDLTENYSILDSELKSFLKKTIYK